MKAGRIGFVLMLAGWFAVAPARAQVDAAALTEEVAGVNRSLERLVSLLERSLNHQRIDLVLKRIDLKERRLAPLESELRKAENTVLRTESEIERVAEMREQQERQISRDLREGTDSPDSEARRMMQKIESMVTFQEGRLDDGRELVRRLEDRLAEGRDDVRILEDMLAEMLGE